jgi:hypothetical protein
MQAQADAWTAAAFGARQAGVVSPLLPISNRFRRSTLPDLLALNDFELLERISDLQDMEFGTDRPDATIREYRAELELVRGEIQRREVDDPTDIGGDEELPPGDSANDEAEFARNKRQVAETTARNLEPGEDAASRARRDRIIANAIGGTLATFNTYLEREYGVQVANINANRDITIARLRNEDRAGDREYRLQLERYRNPGGGGGGGAAPVIGLGLIGLLLSMAKG